LKKDNYSTDIGPLLLSSKLHTVKMQMEGDNYIGVFNGSKRVPNRRIEIKIKNKRKRFKLNKRVSIDL
jgi:hypothetical protein